MFDLLDAEPVQHPRFGDGTTITSFGSRFWAWESLSAVTRGSGYNDIDYTKMEL